MKLDVFRTGAALVDVSERIKLSVRGEQALWFLDQLLTNKLDELEAGRGAEALLLTPKGKIEAVLRVVATERAAFVDGESVAATPLTDFLQGRLFSTKAEVIDRTSDFTILRVLGPRADEVMGAALESLVAGETKEQRDLGLALPGEDEHEATHYGASVIVRVQRPIRGADVWIVAERGDELRQALAAAGGEPVDEQSYEALRTVEGLPRLGVDFERCLPQEAALETAVHFAKGCYLGQESVAMAQRGRVKRRLRHLRFDDERVELGGVAFEGQPAGTITSAATEDGRSGFGIGMIDTRVPIGAAVSTEASGLNAIVNELPATSTGPEVPSARELRERLKS